MATIESKSSPQFCIEVPPTVPERVIPTYGCGGRVRIEAVLKAEGDDSFLNKEVTVAGWSKTVRKQGSGLIFIALNDGSTVKNLQVVVTPDGVSPETYAALAKCGVATAFRVTGTIIESPAQGQKYEMQVADQSKHELRIVGEADQSKYPLAKKSHSKEFLREIAHLRPRTYMMGCVTRIRTALAGAVHEFFQSRGFQYIHTPIITGSDCEGAGEMFQVTTLLPENNDLFKIPQITPKQPKSAKAVDTATGSEEQPAAPSPPKQKLVDYRKDFFGKKTFLTVSGQLNVETYACALSDVYTFGPTFRAELSHTSRHLAEFWMMEPEMAFADLEDNMRCAEAFLRFCVRTILDRHRDDLEWLQENVEQGLISRLENIADSNFARLSYTDAIERLKQEPEGRFQVKPEWGMDMGSEHERFLAEEVYKKPVIVYDYPKDIKAFYMKVNDDGKTVRAMDILVPKIGEVVGGSQREERLDVLDKQIADKGLVVESYSWYRDLRKFGTVPHSGFGVGFERMIMMITGVENIRDVIPFPRAPGLADY